MAKFEIIGGNKLNGSVVVSGSKNATLPILAACLMCKEEIVLKNVPKISDVKNMIKILEALNVKFTWRSNNLIVNASQAKFSNISPGLAKKIRSSIFLLGSLLSRFKTASIAYPGGCNIGSRPIDLHIKGLKELGVCVEEKFGMVSCDAKGIHSGVVVLDFPSVGATENLILASVFSKGETVIINGAREPEIVELCNFLNAMGAKISGAGQSQIKIVGVKKLHSCTFEIIGDRIVAGTFLIATAIVGGRVEICNIKSEQLFAIMAKLKQNCCHIIAGDDKIYISSCGKMKNLPYIETAPYPGFPTDLQSQFLVLASISLGSTVVTENLFETRFRIVPELSKMGAKISIKNKSAFVEGVNKLYGANVYAQDLRGGASLVLAGLVAEGKTVVHNINHIDRGYYKFERDLKKLGANIKRIE